MGLAAFATVDSHMMFINAEVINETDLLLVLSSSGETDELNEAVAWQSNRASLLWPLLGIRRVS